MTFKPDQIKALEAPLNRAHVKPPAPGKYGDYVEGWFVIAEANRIFGFDGWTRDTCVTLLGQPREHDGKWRVDYMAKVRVTAGGIYRDGCGFGQGIDRDVGQAHESALKEAETDATKRALMTFGNSFGLALYDKTQANVEGERPATSARAAPQARQKPREVPREPEKPKTLAEWANDLEAALRAATTRQDAERIFNSAAKLCADLDVSLPERLAEITTLHAEQTAKLPSAKAA